jgi:chromate reductase, NAD(P)H dehydrogenase (quinone)
VTVVARILGISGSLRRQSTNSAVLRTARVVAPAGIEVVVYDGVGGLPHFDPDDDVAPRPPAVDALRGAVRAADALLLSTPEYAGALPGSFKNALDWLIGDGEVGSIYEKPVAWINASPRKATAAHESLRTVLGFAHATIVDAACAEIPVTTAMIGADGSITDPAIRLRIADTLTALVASPRAPA